MTQSTKFIYHLAPGNRWANWPEDQAYVPAEYAADGFIHCTAGDDLMLQVANTFYRQSSSDFVLLVIDPSRVMASVKWEQSDDALATVFPHIYGPISRDAVAEVRRVLRDADGTFMGWQ
ncbi:MAG: DUF952 domain-containing protein [Chloroflexota bacterium]